MITIQKAIERSLNTIPVRLIREQITREASFDFMVNKLGITTLVKSKEITTRMAAPKPSSISTTPRLAMGSLVNGWKLSELANAYQIFANGRLLQDPRPISGWKSRTEAYCWRAGPIRCVRFPKNPQAS